MIIFAKICKSKYYKDFILLFVHPATKDICVKRKISYKLLIYKRLTVYSKRDLNPHGV